MVINITAGECLNVILTRAYPSLKFIPFNEGMSLGSYGYPYFDDTFIKQRSDVHRVSVHDYIEHLKDFLSILKDLDDINHWVLWFGDDDFCLKNVAFIKDLLTVLLHTVDEITGVIKTTQMISKSRNIEK